MDNFSIVIPVFNEENNIINIYNEIKKNITKSNNYEIIFVNDGSTDDSFNIISSISDNRKNILLNFKENFGQSYCIYQGVKIAKYDTIITMDADGQNDPNDMKKIFQKYNSSDNFKLIGGIRIKRKDKIIKIISSKIANFVRSKILQDNCPDTGCSLKIFSKKSFSKFNYFDGMHRFLPALFKGYGYNTAFINVNHRPRISGISKYGTIDRLFKGIIDLIKVRKMLNSISNKND